MTKPFILEFVGGCWDGMNLSNKSVDPRESQLARQTYQRTTQGILGKRVVMPSGLGIARHRLCGLEYEVAHRLETHGEVLVRLECVVRATAPPCPLCRQNLLAVKRIVFEFSGGACDGTILDSCSSDINEALLATAYYCVTEEGTVGTRFRGSLPVWVSGRKSPQEPSDRGRPSQYQVVHRKEQDDSVVLRCESSNAAG